MLLHHNELALSAVLGSRVPRSINIWEFSLVYPEMSLTRMKHARMRLSSSTNSSYATHQMQKERIERLVTHIIRLDRRVSAIYGG
jgi:hypothetical protein